MKYLTMAPAIAANTSLRNAWPLVCSLAIALFSAHPCSAQKTNQPAIGLINIAGAAFNPATGKAYIVDSAAGTVHIINDSDRSAHTIKAGANPTSIAVDTANGRAYIVNAGDGTVTVLNDRTDEIAATLQVGAHPYSIAADSITGKIYVTRTYSDQLMVIDAVTNGVSSIKVGSPDLLAINEKTHTVYLLSYEMGDLAILDEVTHAIKRTSVGMHAWGMTLNPATGVLYFAKIGDGAVAVLAPGSTTPTFIHTGGIPCALAVNTQTNTIYVADYASNNIAVIDGSNSKVVVKIPVGNRPQAVAVDSEHNRVYVANTFAHTISVLDGNTNKVVSTPTVSAAPYALAVDSARQKLHVAALGQPASTMPD